MLSPTQVVAELIAVCNRRDIDGAMALFTEDALYHNIPIAPVHGRTAIRETLGGFLAMAKEVNWVVHHIAANANGIVMTERTYRFLLAGGWLELPVMGVSEVIDGKINAWRDYFDMAPLKPIMGG